MNQGPFFIDQQTNLFREAWLDYGDNQLLDDFNNSLSYGNIGIWYILYNFNAIDLLSTVYDHDYTHLMEQWNIYYTGETIWMINDALLSSLGTDYHTYLNNWAGTYQLSEGIMGDVLNKQKISLSSQHLYGSSRLGVKQYMGGQHFAEWDYTGALPVVDTALVSRTTVLVIKVMNTSRRMV